MFTVKISLPNFNNIVDNMKENVDFAMSNQIDNMVDMAKSICPVDTGFLREHIYKEKIDDCNYEFRSDAEYSKTREFNLDNMPCGPQPYMYPSLDAYEKDLIEDIKIAINYALRR